MNKRILLGRAPFYKYISNSEYFKYINIGIKVFKSKRYYKEVVLQQCRGIRALLTIKSKIGLSRNIRVLLIIKNKIGFNKSIKTPLTIKSKIGLSKGIKALLTIKSKIGFNKNIA